MITIVLLLALNGAPDFPRVPPAEIPPRVIVPARNAPTRRRWR